MADNKVNSGLLEFSEDQKVFVALDAETSEVKKAVTIDGDGVETDIAGGGGGGVTVEALSVTENGTYSEEGKAYSPVTVNVESDFKKAVITLICSGGEGYTSGYIIECSENSFVGACYIDNELGITSEAFSKSAHYGTSQEVVLYLYDDNEAFIIEPNADPTGAYTITGNAEIVNEEGHYFVKVTGDATISTVGDNK